MTYSKIRYPADTLIVRSLPQTVLSLLLSTIPVMISGVMCNRYDHSKLGRGQRWKQKSKRIYFLWGFLFVKRTHHCKKITEKKLILSKPGKYSISVGLYTRITFIPAKE